MTGSDSGGPKVPFARRAVRYGRVLATAAMAAIALSACTTGQQEVASTASSATATQLALRDTALRSLAEQAGLTDPPRVELVRFVSAVEWPQAQIDCLNSEGFPVTATSDGQGVDSSMIPAEQARKGGPLDLARYTCEARYSLEPSGSGWLSDAELGRLFDWYVQESVPCLQAHGIDVASPPSQQQFVESYYSNSAWLPYDSVDAATMPMDEWDALNAACPQSPDADF